MNPTQTQDEPSIELDETGMVVIHDTELLELVSGGNAGGGQVGGVGGNTHCGWHLT